jgi:hypothetical protein
MRFEAFTAEKMHVYIRGYGGRSLIDVYQLGYLKKEVVYSSESSGSLIPDYMAP